MEPGNFCIRCESAGRKSLPNAKHLFFGPNGVKGYICDKCLEELQEEVIAYEIEEDEDAS